MDWFEIDFLPVESRKSGDAIAMRYSVNGQTLVHVVDGGFQGMGDKLLAHIDGYFGAPGYIDNVVVTHPDGDHARGLREVLQNYGVGTLWMLRPWLYASYLIDRFPTYQSVDRLAQRLRQVYPNLAALEDIAVERGIPIRAPFQGEAIGAFAVLAPSISRYFDLIVESEKTPEGDEGDQIHGVLEGLLGLGNRMANFIKGAWGHEVFSTGQTSAENNMSVVQFARIAGETIILNGDAGREALTEAADFAPVVGLMLPGVDKFQVPHHGSRRNVSTELLDRWLGPRWTYPPAEGAERFIAICSSALEDKDHPRKAVERAFSHRGGRFVATEGQCISLFNGAPPRLGWNAVPHRPYPLDYES